jgi:GT2 family glycosyltransferase
MTKVSIIILCWNNLEYTKKCIESLYRYTSDFQLLLVNNASTDGTIDYLREVSKSHENVAIINNSRNEGFAKGNNRALEVATGQYILFLNNDTECIMPNWLDGMVQVLDNNPLAGIVGARLLYPDDKYGKTYIQHAGVFFNGIAPMHIGRNKLDSEVPNNGIEELQAVTGACMLVRKDFAKFDEGYIQGYYEDTDMCMGVREAGYKVFINNNVRLIHHEGRSQILLRAKDTSEFIKITDRNRMRFIERWKHKLI